MGPAKVGIDMILTGSYYHLLFNRKDDLLHKMRLILIHGKV